jgi:hypothetical protein
VLSKNIQPLTGLVLVWHVAGYQYLIADAIFSAPFALVFQLSELGLNGLK